MTQTKPFKVMLRQPRAGQKRAKFEDVVESLWTQIDDLDGDLTNALLIAPPRATGRQVSLALTRISQERGL